MRETRDMLLSPHDQLWLILGIAGVLLFPDRHWFVFASSLAGVVVSAALIYFDKSLPELNLSEAAILASLAQAPSTVNPYRRPERLLARRNYVLNRMVEDGYITKEEAEALKLKLEEAGAPVTIK